MSLNDEIRKRKREQEKRDARRRELQEIAAIRAELDNTASQAGNNGVKSFLDTSAKGKAQARSLDLIACEICDAHILRHRMLAHMSNQHFHFSRLIGSEAIRLWIESAAAIKLESTKPELTAEEEARRKNFAYEASAEFVSEALNNADAQRHNRDDVSLHSTFEQQMSQRQRSIYEYKQEKLKQQEIEKARQQRAALVADKLAQGLAEVVVGCVATLYDIEADETISYYILSDQQEYRHKQRVYIEKYDTPPGGADECLRADCELGKAIIGRFVGDELDAPVPNGVFKCRIQSVAECRPENKPSESASQPAQSRSVQEGQPHARVGSEAWAFFARDNGSFGSISSHDDYSDEADAEIHGSEVYEAEGLDDYE